MDGHVPRHSAKIKAKKKIGAHASTKPRDRAGEDG